MLFGHFYKVILLKRWQISTTSIIVYTISTITAASTHLTPVLTFWQNISAMSLWPPHKGLLGLRQISRNLKIICIINFGKNEITKNRTWRNKFWDLDFPKEALSVQKFLSVADFDVPSQNLQNLLEHNKFENVILVMSSALIYG